MSGGAGTGPANRRSFVLSFNPSLRIGPSGPDEE